MREQHEVRGVPDNVKTIRRAFFLARHFGDDVLRLEETLRKVMNGELNAAIFEEVVE
jgi:hypothetical protein